MMSTERRKHGNSRAFAACALSLLCTLAAADDEATVTTELIAEVRESVRTPEGRDAFTFVPATLLAQGQVVYYTLRIHNPTPVFISDVSVSQRIPANTTYIAGSAAGPAAQVTFSIDGGRTFLPPADLLVDADGQSRSAAPERYTHIRWTLRHALAPGAVALARFRAVFR